MERADPAKILIVDDTPANLQLLSSLLKEQGYTVYPASDGALALEFVSSTLPDLILLDIRMPGMDGFEICRKLKADERTRSIPIIFISILEDAHEKVRAFQEGAVDYITKPFHPEEVLSRVGTHLRLRDLTERLEQKVSERTDELIMANQHLLKEIAERKRTEESLRNSERRLSDVIDFLPDATFAIDLQGTITIWNRAAEQLSGFRSEDMIGKGNYEYALPFYGVRRPVLVDMVLNPDKKNEHSYSNLRRESDLVMGESYTLSKHGERYLLGIAAPLYDSKGIVIGAIESVRDITGRKKAEEEIRAANERFRSVLRASTAYSIIGTDPDGLIKVFNEGAELMLGYTADEMIDKKTADFMHDHEEIAERAAEIGIAPGFEVFVRAARKGETETREWTYIRKDGSRITVLLTITAMRNEQGELTGFIGIARDITNEKKLEQQLLQSQKMESIGLLAGGIAHDFNNLLTPIIGYSEMLTANMQTDDPSRSHLLQISCAAERAKELIQRLLAFSRKQIIELKTIDPGELIRRFEGMLRRTILENVNIQINIAPDIGLIRADAGQIEQILMNLAVNAQDAMPDGGVLTIEAVNADLDESYTARHAEIVPGEYVMLAVSDTGGGMDEKTLERIFEPFFTTKESGRGTGLGLSTVYGIVKQHGGSVSVYSEKGRGSSFKVFLPKVISGQSVEKQVSIKDTVARGTETILVVEDDDVVRDFVTNMLEALGYRVLAAEDSDHGIEAAKMFEGEIDLLLTDVVMPRMNGRELYEVLRRTRSGIRVLFMSGYTTNVIGHQCVLDEGVPFIAKPFTIHSIAQKIRNVLDNRRSETP